MGKQIYTSGEVANLLGIPPRTARRYITNGKIEATQNQVTGTWTITRESLISFMKDRGVDSSLLLASSKILLVSNDAELLSFISSILATHSNDYEVLQTTNGYEALIQIGDIKPDLICLDIPVEGINNEQLISTIKVVESVNHLKLLMLTGVQNNMDKLLDNGADEVLAKPFTANDIIAKINGLLS